MIEEIWIAFVRLTRKMLRTGNADPQLLHKLVDIAVLYEGGSLGELDNKKQKSVLMALLKG